MITKTCEVCGKEFTVRNYRKDTARFCSINCLNKWLGEKHTNTKRSEETCNKMRVALTGKKRTPEQCDRIGKSKLGKEPWNKGKSGMQVGANKGKKFSPEWKAKLSKYRKGVYCKEKHPLWQGGKSFEPYCQLFDDTLKERVRIFFGYKCVKCGMTQDENRRSLHIHHVDYNKNVCCDRNPAMLVSLCTSCHAKTNFNRRYWRLYFRELLAIQYGNKVWKERIKKG